MLDRPRVHVGLDDHPADAADRVAGDRHVGDPDPSLVGNEPGGDGVEERVPLLGQLRDDQGELASAEARADPVKPPAAVSPRRADSQQLDHGRHGPRGSLRNDDGSVKFAGPPGRAALRRAGFVLDAGGGPAKGAYEERSGCASSQSRSWDRSPVEVEIRSEVPSGRMSRAFTVSPSCTSRIAAIWARNPGSSTGNAISTRRSRLRGIQSADASKYSDASPFWKKNTRACSRKRSTIETARMRSESPGMPGRRQQIPRMIRSIWTPASLAR